MRPLPRYPNSDALFNRKAVPMLDAQVHKEPSRQSYFRQAVGIESGVCFILPAMTHDMMQAII